MYATLDEECVGTLVLNWGGDAPFSSDLKGIFSLDPFLALVSEESILTVSGFMIKPEYRGTMLSLQMISCVAEFAYSHNVQLVFQ